MCCNTQHLRIEVTQSQNQVSYVMQACPQQYSKTRGSQECEAEAQAELADENLSPQNLCTS